MRTNQLLTVICGLALMMLGGVWLWADSTDIPVEQLERIEQEYETDDTAPTGDLSSRIERPYRETQAENTAAAWANRAGVVELGQDNVHHCSCVAFAEFLTATIRYGEEYDLRLTQYGEALAIQNEDELFVVDSYVMTGESDKSVPASASLVLREHREKLIRDYHGLRSLATRAERRDARRLNEKLTEFLYVTRQPNTGGEPATFAATACVVDSLRPTRVIAVQHCLETVMDSPKAMPFREECVAEAFRAVDELLRFDVAPMLASL